VASEGPATATSLAEELDLNGDERDLVAALLRLEVTPGQIRDAAREGRVEDAIFGGVMDPERERRTVSAAEIEAGGGLAAAEIRAVLRAMGLAPPGPEEPYFTPEEATVFRELGGLEEVWPPDVRHEASRVYGQALGRIAQTELHLFRARVAPLLREITSSPLDGLSAVRQAIDRLLPLADPMLLGVHRRKLEHEMTQAAVWEVETQAEELMPATVEVSLLFCDLRHFTSYANRHGDAAAIRILDRMAMAVEENLGQVGRLVKTLGDGYLLAHPDPESAVASALAIAAAMGPDGPALHAGLHHGRAVFREGDYYGRAVNLAARLLTRAEADQLLATAGVAAATPDRPWRSRGETILSGFSDPLELFALELQSPKA
jgi:adenylate cyclase